MKTNYGKFSSISWTTPSSIRWLAAMSPFLVNRIIQPFRDLCWGQWYWYSAGCIRPNFRAILCCRSLRGKRGYRSRSCYRQAHRSTPWRHCLVREHSRRGRKFLFHLEHCTISLRFLFDPNIILNYLLSEKALSTLVTPYHYWFSSIKVSSLANITDEKNRPIFSGLQLFAIHLRAQDDLPPVENVTAAQVANTKTWRFSILRSRMGSHVQSPSNGP